MESGTFRFEDFPDDPFELRGKLFAFGLEERISDSIKFIANFPKKDTLYFCSEFMDYVYLDCFRGDRRETEKHGRIPLVETTYQYDFSIKYALSGSYKAAFEHLRSCLELTLLSIYFSFQKNVLDDERILTASVEEMRLALKEEKKWIRSLANTPFFTEMLKVIFKDWRFKEFDNSFQFVERIKANYYQLSDYSHIKGYKMSTQNLSDTRIHFSASSFHSINLKSLNSYLDALIETIQNIAVIISLYNPIVLAYLPLEEKFGLNEPVGFVQPGQSDLINSTIAAEYRNYFKELALNDVEVSSIVEWVNTQPSLTQDDWEKQIKDFNSLFKEKGNGDNEGKESRMRM